MEIWKGVIALVLVALIGIVAGLPFNDEREKVGDRYSDYGGGSSGSRDRYPSGDRNRESDRYRPEFDYVTFFERPNFRGWSFNAPLSNRCKNLENDYNNYNNGISSVKTHGNCIVVFTRYDCRGREHIVRPRYDERGRQERDRYRPIGHGELAEDLNNSISSYRRC